MTTYEVSTVINRPVGIVVKALMNPDNYPYWHTGLEKFEVVEGKPGEVDSVGRLHYSERGNSYVMEEKLIYRDPTRKYVSQVTGDALTARVETILISSGGRTKVTIEWSRKAKALPLKLLLPLMRGKMMRQSKAELETFKALVETKGSDFGGSEAERDSSELLG